MAEPRGEKEDGREPVEGVAGAEPAETVSPETAEVPGAAPEQSGPLDEEAAWAEIVAAYGEEPTSPPVAAEGEPVRSFTVYAAGTGPRDWDTPEPSEEDFDETDEGHFVSAEPPPLPKPDTTAKFAWLAVLGGPLLLILMVIFQQPMTWWSTLLGIGGFLGGFGTLVARMRPGGAEDEELPGGGAVV